jgi:hypothetical protein
MIQQLQIPPAIPAQFIDTLGGTILYSIPASSVTLVGGSLTAGPVVPTGGTLVPALTSVNPVDIFDWADYRVRDQELSGRDHVVAAATVQVSATAATIFGAPVVRPVQVAPASTTLPELFTDHTIPVKSNGTLTYVNTTSVPSDEVSADGDLYGRDLLLYETLVRASAVMAHPPLITADPHGTNVTGISDLWSYAEPATTDPGVNPALRLDVDLFKRPDQVLAYVDNSLGVYVAAVANYLTNPFRTADRILLASIGGFNLEPDVYTHDSTQDTANTRVWTAEPTLPGRFKLVYYYDTGLLRWYPPDSTYIHTPQLQPMLGGGTTLVGPNASTLQVIVDVPARQDSAYFAKKAAQVVTCSSSVHSLALFSGAYSAGIDQGNLVQNAQLTFNNAIRFQSFPSFGAGTLLVGITTIPQSYYEVLGCQLVGVTPTPTSGGVFPAGTTTAATYSTVLLPGNYTLEVTYTNTSGATPDSFPVVINWGTATIANTALPFGSLGLSDGQTNTQTYNVLSDGLTGGLSITWVAPATTSQLVITRIRLRSLDTSSLAIQVAATLYDGGSVIGTTQALCNGVRNRPDVLWFQFPISGPVTTPNIILSLVNNSNLPALAINQIQFGLQVASTPTPNAAGFVGYPEALLDRALHSVQDAFQTIPNFVDPRVNGFWTPLSTAQWLAQIAGQEPRLYSAFQPAGPLDVGKPMLVPFGLAFDISTGLVVAGTNMSPTLRNATPWLLGQRFLVAVNAFMGLTS